MVKTIMEAGSIEWSNEMNQLPSHEQTHLPQPLCIFSQRLSNIPFLVGKKSTDLSHIMHVY